MKSQPGTPNGTMTLPLSRQRGEVSCAWTAVALEVAARFRGCEEMVASEWDWGGRADGGLLRSPLQWIDWDTFREFVEQLTARLDGPREWFQFGRQMGAPSLSSGAALRFLVSPSRLTDWSFRRLESDLVRVARTRGSRTGNDRLRVELRLAEGFASSTPFLWITAGQAAAIPTTLGLPESLVDAKVDSDGATLDVHLPPSETLAARFSRTVHACTALRRSLDSLEVKRFELERSRRELEGLARDFRQLIDASPHGIFVHSGGVIHYANQAFATSLGFPDREHLKDQVVSELLAFDDSRQAEVFVGRGSESDRLGMGTTEVRARLLSGKQVHSEVFFDVTGSRTVVFEGRSSQLVFCRDITQRRALERQVLDSGENERQRIALELHDGLGQLLAALSMQAQTLGIRASSGAEATAAILEPSVRELAATANEAMELSRSLARGLAPVAEFEGGLPFALRRLAQRQSGASGMRVQLTIVLPEEFHSAGSETDLHCYRIAQEAVNNATKHAKATEIEVRLCYEPSSDQLELTIMDDGIGLPSEVDSSCNGSNSGIGIRAMHYRASAIGGRLEIGSGPNGRGTCVTLQFSSKDCRVPLGAHLPNLGQLTAIGELT
ncbi:MAG: histidine kinase [Verrucomicrobiales bacterium]